MSASLSTWLKAIAAGDRQAFESLYQATSAKLFGVILRILGRHDWSEEVLQEAYLAVWKSAGQFRDDRGTPMTWLITIARNRALDRRRREHGEIFVDDESKTETVADSQPSPLENAISSSEAQALHACLDELESAHRDCLALAYMEGLSHSELSARLERPLGTIKSWIRRAQAQLKDCLER